MGDLTLALAGHRHPGPGRTRHYQDSVRASQHTGGDMTTLITRALLQTLLTCPMWCMVYSLNYSSDVFLISLIGFKFYVILINISYDEAFKAFYTF